jgi:diguanylate cyclase (GGDEF)-like protein
MSSVAPTTNLPLRPHDEVEHLRCEIDRLQTQLAEALDHVSRLEALAHEDALTATQNRRGFMRDLGRAIAYRNRYGTPAALLVADLDAFKIINDRLGHDAGDRCLSHVAGLLKTNIRASDTLGRLGGDEFAVIIWQVDAGFAEQKARMLESIVAETPLLIDQTRLTLGISIGVTELTERDAPEAALARADRAMYARKAERRSPQAMISGVI